MHDLKAYVDYYLAKLDTSDHDNAWHSLIEADPKAIPLLIEAFRAEQNVGVRAEIVEIIWQHRRPETIPFLAEVLDDPEPEVWKAGLDGLVALGGDAALEALAAARQRVKAALGGGAVQLEWIDEAIEQIRV